MICESSALFAQLSCGQVCEIVIAIENLAVSWVR